MMITPVKNYLARGCLIFLLLSAITSLSYAQASGNQSDVDWLIEVLDIEPGSIVADIGAGDGNQTMAIAQHIGSKGTIYSTELGTQSIDKLKNEVGNAEANNVIVLKGHPRQTNLPDQCCDAIYLRRVYHHITNPETFTASLFQSLKPGGRLAIIDFEPRGNEADPKGRSSGNQHGVTAETVIKELTKSGFSFISSKKGSGRDIYVVLQKPKGSS